MPLLQSDEPNLIDAEAPNWRVVVYPLLALLIIVVGGLGYYFYEQDQRNQAEADARVALVKATTPADDVKVADRYPHTDQATLALLSAADASFTKHDFDSALADYRRVTGDSAVDATLRDAAQLGVAATLEATGKRDEAIAAYLEVARRGDKSPYAPFAYNAVSRFYDWNGDKKNERQILEDAARLDPESLFTKQAQYKLKQMAAADKPMPGMFQPPTSGNAPAGSPSVTPKPVAPTPATPTPAASATPAPVAPLSTPPAK